jgi:hypothetical protein
MSLTYNQIIKISRAFQQAHYILKNFGNGGEADMVLHNQLATYKYPLIWMNDAPSTYQEGLESFNFRVFFLAPAVTLKDRGTDLMSVNVNEVKSDMIQCANDFITYWIQQTDNYNTLGFDKSVNRDSVDNYTNDDLTGCYIDIRFYQPLEYNECAIPMGTPTSLPDTCAPVLIYEDGILVDTIASGGTYSYTSSGSTTLDVSVNGTLFYNDVSTNQDLPVKDSTGANNVGSKVGSEWRISDTQVILKNTANETLSTQNFYAESQANEMVADNVTSDFNGVTLLQETPSGQNKSIIVQTVDANPIGDVIEDTPNILRIEIQNSQALNTSNPFKTGQKTSYAVNDDGDLERGNGADFTTLSHNNYFGNTNRFTDDLGGQTYTSGWVIDWATWNQITGDFIMWYKTAQTGATWTNALAGQPYSVGGFADCLLPNATEIGMLYNFGLASALNYAPFNYTVAGTATNLWTTTTVPSATTTAIAFQGLVVEAARAKTLVIAFFVMRYGNISEL